MNLRFCLPTFALLLLGWCEQPPQPPAIQAAHDAKDAREALDTFQKNSTFFFDEQTQACWLYFENGYGKSMTQVDCSTARRRMASSMIVQLEEVERRLGSEIP